MCPIYTIFTIFLWYADFVCFWGTLSSNVADILEAGWVNFSYTYTHAITKRLQIKTPGFPKKLRLFFLVLRFYRFRVLLEVLKIQPNDPPNDPRTTPRTTPDSWVARRIDHNMKCGTPCATAPLLHPKPSNKENERPSHPKEVCKRNDQRDVSPM